MLDSVHRYQALFQRMEQKAILLNDVLWTSYQRMIVPVGPVSYDYAIPSGKSLNDLRRFFKECILIRAGSGFVKTPDTWHCVLCERPVDLSALSENTRSKVRRGLKNCIVRRIDTHAMEAEAWPVYSAAFTRYKNPMSMEKEQRFKREIVMAEGFEDIIHYWGVFEKQTGRLIAYSLNYLYDKAEVNYRTIIFHPDYLRLYPSYALFYEMNKYYLEEQKFSYVNDGFRSLLHETNIQDFLVTKFFFKKQPVGLKIYYRPIAGMCIAATYPARHFFGKLSRPLTALYKLEEINRR